MYSPLQQKTIRTAELPKIMLCNLAARMVICPRRDFTRRQLKNLPPHHPAAKKVATRVLFFVAVPLLY
jgi:hypothetical protein